MAMPTPAAPVEGKGIYGFGVLERCRRPAAVYFPDKAFQFLDGPLTGAKSGRGLARLP